MRPKTKLARCGLTIIHRIGLYSFWSGLVRRYDVAKYNLDLVYYPYIQKLSDAAAILEERSIVWSKDRWYVLFDAMSDGRKVELSFWRYQHGRSILPNVDCDEFAHFAYYLLESNNIKHNAIYQIVWYDTDAHKIVGHHVVIHREPNGTIWHLSNFGLRGPYSSVRAAFDSVAGIQFGNELVGVWRLIADTWLREI